MLRRLGDADARTDRGLRRYVGAAGAELERRAVEGQAVMHDSDAERLAELAGARAERARILDPAPAPHRLDPHRRLERPDQHGAGAALRLADEVQAPVDAVGAVDIGVARRPEHHGVARRLPAIGVCRRVRVVVGLDLNDDPADPAKEERRADEVGRDRVDAAVEEAPGEACWARHGRCARYLEPSGGSKDHRRGSPRSPACNLALPWPLMTTDKRRSTWTAPLIPRSGSPASASSWPSSSAPWPDGWRRNSPAPTWACSPTSSWGSSAPSSAISSPGCSASTSSASGAT